MADSSIEWTDATWNPVTGCTRASEGCDNCYAVKMTKRLDAMGQEKYKGLVNLGKNHFNGVVKCHEDALLLPLSWKKGRRVFVNSMSDLFHKDVPFDFVARVWLVMALCRQQTFQILTKRPERMAEFLRWHGTEQISPEAVNACRPLFAELEKILGFERYEAILAQATFPLPNVWLGTSVENQEQADKRIPNLLNCPAAVRFLSCEPLLGPVDLTNLNGLPHYEPMFQKMRERMPDMKESDSPFAIRMDCLKGWSIQEYADEFAAKGISYKGVNVSMPSMEVETERIHWVIAGGESGPNARPMDLIWFYSLLDQCKAASVPIFIKQLGKSFYNSAYNHGDDVFSAGPAGRDWDHVAFPDDLKVRDFPQVAS